MLNLFTVYLAANDIFGKVESPAPIGQNPTSDLGNLIGVLLAIAFTVAGIVALIFMMWGALNWITAGGDKEKLMKAQARIRNALIGIFMLIIVVAIFATVFQVVLGGTIVSFKNGALEFNLPTLGSPITPDICVPTGGGGKIC